MIVTSRWMCAAGIALGLFTPSELHAQSPLDRIVGPDEHGAPVTIRHLVSQDIGRLATVVGVPFGLERLAGPLFEPLPEFTATGMTLRAALNEIQRRDPRYRWHEMDGVIVLRPATEWNRPAHFLATPVAPLRVDGIAARHALRIACASVGVASPDLRHGDTITFALDFAGGSLLDLLNTIVRSHGRLTWSAQPNPENPNFPISVAISSGTEGRGCGAPGIRLVVSATGEPVAPEPINLEPLLYDLPRAAPIASVALDQVIPATPELKARGMFDSIVTTLADAVDVPFVFERDILLQPIPGDGIPLNGLTLRAALDILSALDQRYSWREMNGAIVIRPHVSWGDSNHPLFRMAPGFELEDASLSRVVLDVLRFLGRDDPSISLGDSRQFPLHAPAAPLLDQLIAIARAHGQLTWIFRAADPSDARRGLPYSLEVRTTHGGTGHGFLLPENAARTIRSR
jgi:hypothetical protein